MLLKLTFVVKKACIVQRRGVLSEKPQKDETAEASSLRKKVSLFRIKILTYGERMVAIASMVTYGPKSLTYGPSLRDHDMFRRRYTYVYRIARRGVSQL